MTTEHIPEVQGPNDRPRPHEFDTSQVVYGDGSPNVPEPEWMSREAERVQGKSGRAKTLMTRINSDFYWFGKVLDSDDTDRQNGIKPPFEP